MPVLARKPGALRNGAPFKDWVLPAALERIRRKLAGADDGNRRMVDILTAVLADGLPAVEAACAEAMAEGGHSADGSRRSSCDQEPAGTSATLLQHCVRPRAQAAGSTGRDEVAVNVKLQQSRRMIRFHSLFGRMKAFRARDCCHWQPGRPNFPSADHRGMGGVTPPLGLFAARHTTKARAKAGLIRAPTRA